VSQCTQTEQIGKLGNMTSADQTNSIFGSGIATLNPSMPVSNDGILSWLNANPNATDTTIAQTMQQYGVSPDQMAQATGMISEPCDKRTLPAWLIDDGYQLTVDSWSDQRISIGS